MLRVHCCKEITTRMLVTFFLILGLLGCNASSKDHRVSVSRTGELVSGPMAGVPKGASVQIWLQTNNPVSVSMKYWITGVPERPLYWHGVTQADGIAVIDVDGLSPFSEYSYQLTLANTLHPEVFRFQTLAQQYRPQIHDVSFLFGSCSWWNEDQYPLIDTMAEHSADFMLWTGDNLYLEPWEYDHASGIEKKYRKVRRHASLNNLLRSKAQVAVWDDHDYGRNDATRDWIFKQEATRTFNRYWVNPSAGTPDIPGIQTQFRMSDVDFILLDGRSYRDNPNLSPVRQLYGDEQMRWVKNMLLTSRAKLKVLVSGSQWLNANNTWEGWNRYPKEQQEFLAWLLDNNIPGVVFISGDRHFTEMHKLERDNAYPLYEASCSPMTSGINDKLSDEEKNSSTRIPGTLVQAHNYCEMRVTGKKGARKLSISSYNTQGERNWKHDILFTTLGL